MSKYQKLLERIRNNPANVRFEDLDRVLTGHGFIRRQPRSGSSHYTYRKSNVPMILTIPIHRPIKEIYVKQVLRAIDEYGDFPEQNEEAKRK